jgi:hypothetical protein
MPGSYLLLVRYQYSGMKEYCVKVENESGGPEMPFHA